MPPMGVLEARFADIIWTREPMASKDLIKLAAAELNWKSTTSYTVLQRLCKRAFSRLTDKNVISLMPREDFYGRKRQECT